MKQQPIASDKAIDIDAQYEIEPLDAHGGYWDRATRYSRYLVRQS